MVAAASIIPGGFEIDESVLRLHPDASGPQHDEQKGSFFTYGLRKLPNTETIVHKSVYERFAAGPVVLFDKIDLYRPLNINQHVDFLQYYDPKVQKIRSL